MVSEREQISGGVVDRILSEREINLDSTKVEVFAKQNYNSDFWNYKWILSATYDGLEYVDGVKVASPTDEIFESGIADVLRTVADKVSRNEDELRFKNKYFENL